MATISPVFFTACALALALPATAQGREVELSFACTDFHNNSSKIALADTPLSS